MEKQKLLYQQARLHDRGAAEMVLQTISASKGELHIEGPQINMSENNHERQAALSRLPMIKTLII